MRGVLLTPGGRLASTRARALSSCGAICRAQEEGTASDRAERLDTCAGRAALASGSTRRSPTSPVRVCCKRQSFRRHSRENFHRLSTASDDFPFFTTPRQHAIFFMIGERRNRTQAFPGRAPRRANKTREPPRPSRAARPERGPLRLRVTRTPPRACESRSHAFRFDLKTTWQMVPATRRFHAPNWHTRARFDARAAVIVSHALAASKRRRRELFGTVARAHGPASELAPRFAFLALELADHRSGFVVERLEHVFRVLFRVLQKGFGARHAIGAANAAFYALEERNELGREIAPHFIVALAPSLAAASSSRLLAPALLVRKLDPSELSFIRPFGCELRACSLDVVFDCSRRGKARAARRRAFARSERIASRSSARTRTRSDFAPLSRCYALGAAAALRFAQSVFSSPARAPDRLFQAGELFARFAPMLLFDFLPQLFFCRAPSRSVTLRKACSSSLRRLSTTQGIPFEALPSQAPKSLHTER